MLDGLLLYAKQSGITSFTSLWAAKRAFNTKKIGHTGTLDNFADGLLIVLINRTRKLSAYITDFDKTYEAVIRFGSQTDTLDTDGNIIKTAPLPSETDFRNAVSTFIGTIEQIPPVYSAVQVNGQRASTLTRLGNAPELKKRTVTVYSIDIVDFTGEYAHIRVSCSKGTYIRTLAKDIANSCGSCGYLAALRRTAIGSFLLQDAVGFGFLPEFSIEYAKKQIHSAQHMQKKSPSTLPEPSAEDLQKSLVEFTPHIAEKCGFSVVFLKKEYISDFNSGRNITLLWFEHFTAHKNKHIAVFVQLNNDPKTNGFCGLIEQNGKRFKYTFVIQN